MKRWIAALLALMFALSCGAAAEGAMAELRNMRKNAGNRIVEMEPAPSPAPSTDPEPTPEVHYAPLSQGMKGEDVEKLQRRLIETGHLKGRADGSYGAKTASAVRAFQAGAGLEATGEADDATQQALFSADLPSQAEYAKLDYPKALDASGEYEGTPVQFEGMVLQVLTSDQADARGAFTVLRVAIKGALDDVVYVATFLPAGETSVAEGNSVRVRGVARGLYTYDSEGGNRVTLPRVGDAVVEVE